MYLEVLTHTHMWNIVKPPASSARFACPKISKKKHRMVAYNDAFLLLWCASLNELLQGQGPDSFSL